MVDAAVVGVLGTLAGGVVAGGFQFLNARSAGQRELKKALLVDRRTAYVEFMHEWRRQRDHLYDSSLERPIYEDPPDDYWQPLYDLTDPIRLVAGRSVADAADEAVAALRAWVGAADKDVAARGRSMSEAFGRFLDLAQRSLS